MIRLIRSIAVATVVTATAGAQSGRVPVKPPTPPAPPTPQAAPAPAPAPRPMRVLRPADVLEWDGDRYRMRMNADDLRELQEQQREASRAIADAAREANRMSSEQLREISQQAREAAQQALEASRLDLNGLNVHLAPLAQVVPVPPMTPMSPMAPMVYRDGMLMSGPSFGPRYKDDPADTLWTRATQLMNDRDYRAAAQRFKDLRQKYPSSKYVADAMYWQAFALYRVGGETDLRDALAVLDDEQKQFPNARFRDQNGSLTDAAGLANRIRANLAARGDNKARQELSQAASGGSLTCDKEDQQIRSEALSALMRIDADAAMPKLNDILSKRDDCSMELRRRALQIITSRGDEKAVATLLTIAKSDPSTQMRIDAIGFVVRYPNEEVLSTLENLAKTEQIDNIRRVAARNLVGYPAPRAKQIVRGLVEDNTANETMRVDIVNQFNDERGTTDDAAWMRGIYTKVTSNRVKQALVNAIGRIGGPDNQKWLMDLSVSDQETAQVRSDAFRLVSRNMTVAELSKNYDNAGSRPMRQSIIDALNRRKEPEALDKLIDIARKGTDPVLRADIINKLTDRKDPKITQLLIELIGK